MHVNYLQNILNKLSALQPTQYREADELKIHTVEAFKQLFPSDSSLIRSIQSLGFSMFHHMPNNYNRDAFLDSKNMLASVLAAKIEVLKHLPISKTLNELEQSNENQVAIIEQLKTELKNANERLATARSSQLEHQSKLQRLEAGVKSRGLTVMLKNSVFWSTVIGFTGLIFMAGWYAGNTKFDKDKIALSDANRSLEDSIKLYQKGIKHLQSSSDSAHQILGHMPYSEMNLDTSEYHKVQSTIERAGHLLYLNTNYKVK